MHEVEVKSRHKQLILSVNNHAIALILIFVREERGGVRSHRAAARAARPHRAQPPGCMTLRATGREPNLVCLIRCSAMLPTEKE